MEFPIPLESPFSTHPLEYVNLRFPVGKEYAFFSPLVVGMKRV
jgi:hypothetical protein